MFFFHFHSSYSLIEALLATTALVCLMMESINAIKSIFDCVGVLWECVVSVCCVECVRVCVWVGVCMGEDAGAGAGARVGVGVCVYGSIGIVWGVRM